jgi:hypothetical protein
MPATTAVDFLANSQNVIRVLRGTKAFDRLFRQPPQVVVVLFLLSLVLVLVPPPAPTPAAAAALQFGLLEQVGEHALQFEGICARASRGCSRQGGAGLLLLPCRRRVGHALRFLHAARPPLENKPCGVVGEKGRRGSKYARAESLNSSSNHMEGSKGLAFFWRRCMGQLGRRERKRDDKPTYPGCRQASGVFCVSEEAGP